MDHADKSVRFVSDSVEFKQDDICYTLAPEVAKVETANDDATTNRIVDLHVLESPRFHEIAPQLFFSVAMVALLNGKKGYT